MAFTVLPTPGGKHRRPRAGLVRRGRSNFTGVAVLTAAGSLAVTAMATPAQADTPAGPPTATSFTQALDVTGTLADVLAAQAAAQHKAAEIVRRKAEKARREAAEKARKGREDRERAARAEKERKRLNAFVLPIAGSYVSTPYEVSSGRWSSGHHTGIDFHAAWGTSVHAVGAGTVVEADWGGAYGNNVVIRMFDGMYTQYGHLSSIEVSVGQTVTPGQRIGLSGATGNTTGPHLHFEARTGPQYGSDVDPVAYLRSHGIAV